MGGSRAHGWSKLTTGATCVLLALPVLIDLGRSPRYRAFGYAAADTFYYLGIARTAIEHGSLSTDGAHPTNGFHPLWQLVVIAVYGACQLLGNVDAALLVTVLASLACTTAAVWVLGQAFRLGAGSVPITFLLLPIGVYALLASYYWHVGPPNALGGLEGPLPVYGTLYAFVNGMESGLTLLAFALLARTFLLREADTSASSGLKCGGACALLYLARLDHAAFVLTPFVLWSLELVQPRARRRFLLAALAAGVVPLVLYCAINLAYVGVAIPISGLEKSSFPMPYLDQVKCVVQLFQAPLAPMLPPTVYRVLPMVVGPLAALLHLTVVSRLRLGQKSLSFSLRAFATRLDVFLVKMAPGILLLSSYDLFYVNGVGHWYFPVPTLYVSVVCVSLSHSALRSVRFPAALSAFSAAASSALVLALFLRFEYKPDYHHEYARFYWETAPRVRAKLAGKVPQLVEVDDGIVAYGLHVASISGGGLLLDPEAVRARRAQRLFDVAYHRGFHAVSTFFYANHGHLREGDEASAHTWAQQVMSEDLSKYSAKVLYDDATFSIVELSQKGSS